MSLKIPFNFYLDRVNSREIALFTSYVRVLDFRLEHQWRHQQTDAHVVIYGTAVSRDIVIEHQKNASHALFLTTHETGDQFLQLPLNSNEIEAKLNHIGRLISPKVNAKPSIVIDPNEPYRLLRWPPSTMLQTADWIRLSTLMTKRPLSVNELHKHTGLALNQCRLFLEELLKHGLLVAPRTHHSPQRAAPQIHIDIEKKAHRSTVLSLIRNNLARFSAMSTHQ